MAKLLDEIISPILAASFTSNALGMYILRHSEKKLVANGHGCSIAKPVILSRNNAVGKSATAGKLLVYEDKHAAKRTGFDSPNGDGSN
jgi:hypothetical protein